MMHIGLLGFGVVGGGVWALCAPRDDLNVKRVLLRSPKEGLPEEVVTFNADDILNDPEIDTVVEVMGGLHPAYEYVSAALARGKNVVTANKALIAAYYTELTALAREKGAALRCTAAVGGGIPWLTNLERVKRLDTVCAVGGIMNGTTNFIMDAMHKAPVDFPAILKEAQDLGYAEADPSGRHRRRRHPPQAVHLRQHRLRRGAGGDSHPHLWHPDGDGGGYCGLPGPRFCLQAAGPGREHGQRRVRLCGAHAGGCRRSGGGGARQLQSHHL